MKIGFLFTVATGAIPVCCCMFRCVNRCGYQFRRIMSSTIVCYSLRATAAQNSKSGSIVYSKSYFCLLYGLKYRSFSFQSNIQERYSSCSFSFQSESDRSMRAIEMNRQMVFSIYLKTRESGNENVLWSFVRLVIFNGKYFGTNDHHADKWYILINTSGM